MKFSMAKNRTELSRKQLIKSWTRTLIVASAIFIIFTLSIFIYLNSYTRHGERYTLPSFAGMTVEQAKETMEDMNIEFDITDSIYVQDLEPGVIIDQYPKAGNFIKSGRRLIITINTFSPKSVKIPYVTGYSLRQAKNRIMSAGLTINRLIYEPDMAKNNVLKQTYNGKVIDVKSNIIVPVGEGIELYVGIDDTTSIINVPNVLGEQLLSAKNRMWEEGVNVSIIADEDALKGFKYKAVIYEQYPYPNDSIKYGQEVALYVTTDSTKLSNALINERKRLSKIKMLEKSLIKLNDTLLLFENPYSYLIDSFLVMRDSLFIDGKADTILVFDKIVYQKKVEEVNSRLDSLKIRDL